MGEIDSGGEGGREFGERKEKRGFFNPCRG